MAHLAEFTEENLCSAFNDFNETLEDENCEVVPRQVDEAAADDATISLEVIDSRIYLG